MQVLTFPLKEGVRLHFQHYVKIARRAAIGANVALFLITNAGAIFHACRHPHVNNVFFHQAAFALALAAGIGNYPPLALAGRAGPRDAEHRLLIAHLAAAGACWACAGTFRSRRPAAFALLAGFITADLDLRLLAERGFFKGERNIRASVTAALHTGTATTATAHIHTEEVAEDVAENVADISEVRSVKPAKATSAIHS